MAQANLVSTYLTIDKHQLNLKNNRLFNLITVSFQSTLFAKVYFDKEGI